MPAHAGTILSKTRASSTNEVDTSRTVTVTRKEASAATSSERCLKHISQKSDKAQAEYEKNPKSDLKPTQSVTGKHGVPHEMGTSFAGEDQIQGPGKGDIERRKWKSSKPKRRFSRYYSGE